MPLQRLLESSEVRRFGASVRCGLFLGPYLGFGLSYREAGGEDVVTQTQLILLQLKSQQRPRMAHAQSASLDIVLQHLREFEQAQGIRNRRAVLAYIACHVLLPQVKLGLQTLVSACLFQWVQVLALQVLQQCQSQDFLVTCWFDERGDGLKAGHLRRTPAALSGDELEAIMVTAHDNRLQEPLRLEGTGEF